MSICFGGIVRSNNSFLLIISLYVAGARSYKYLNSDRPLDDLLLKVTSIEVC